MFRSLCSSLYTELSNARTKGLQLGRRAETKVYALAHTLCISETHLQRIPLSAVFECRVPDTSEPVESETCYNTVCYVAVQEQCYLSYNQANFG